jgi:hypothetical protein
MCEGCNELGRGCGYTYPVSIRSEKAIALLAKGLKVVADAKSGEVSSLRVRYQDILSAFKLVAPYSGMLDERWVAKEFLGNQQFAIDNIAQGIGTELNAMSSRLKTGYTEAIAGKLTEQTKEQFQGRWGWYGDLLVAFNTAAKGAGDLTTLDPETLAKARLQYPVLRWME